MSEKKEEIRFKASQDELERLEAFKRRFNIKTNAQALRMLISLAGNIKFELQEQEVSV